MEVSHLLELRDALMRQERSPREQSRERWSGGTVRGSALAVSFSGWRMGLFPVQRGLFEEERGAFLPSSDMVTHGTNL